MRGAGKDPLLELPIAQRDVAVPAAILVRVDAASRVHEQDARAGHPPAELPARGDLAEIGYRNQRICRCLPEIRCIRVLHRRRDQ